MRGGHQSSTLNVIYDNVCHTLKFMNQAGHRVAIVGFGWKIQEEDLT